MKKNSTLEKNLKKYTALAGSMTAVVGAVNAQVVYTDVNPDLVLNSAGTTLGTVDFNNDGTVDIAFIAATTSWTQTVGGYNARIDWDGVQAGFGSSANANNGWMGSATSSGQAVAGLSSGVQIGSGGSFFQANGTVGAGLYVSYPSSTSFNFPTTQGAVSGGSEAFIGVRFDISGATHYGWIRVEMSADSKSMTIKDYAYESTADTPIMAGSQASMASVDELASQVTVRNINNNLNIKLEGINNADLTVVGLDGKQYINQVVGSVDVVSLGDLSTGIYLVNISTEEGLTTTQKIYVK